MCSVLEISKLGCCVCARARQEVSSSETFRDIRHILDIGITNRTLGFIVMDLHQNFVLWATISNSNFYWGLVSNVPFFYIYVEALPMTLQDTNHQTTNLTFEVLYCRLIWWLCSKNVEMGSIIHQYFFLLFFEINDVAKVPPLFTKKSLKKQSPKWMITNMQDISYNLSPKRGGKKWKTKT